MMELVEEKLARAISAFSRREILRLLADQELTVTEIAEQTTMSVSLASRHLKMLYDLGFLAVKAQFPNKFYSLKVKELKELLVVYDKVITKL
ncbi:helix-turn-helix transcriptional regulator [Candidatus Woesearchaeota archaeon]|nr:helix-turn-helix transcriptional regulator [Candidatus Woesearchaeota archaeon]